ncbi:protein O-linked-mannose beta-1,2-N-acetylglucosaminyltransferase 1-like [Amphibalanus amphitrite]|uniref:protein O-linked-mannose beta-1,2-N-acetylglucosaminyltransferase 1-like n=1 Tax=Amphibalanus amphitrite TaxID=1232801 RepID=UPI001C9010F3|nr:protein O-linked-mannose beta-1,2-N-acetylglucosaminyltransferase 1-like [Amphibalanus amphitrite]
MKIHARHILLLMHVTFGLSAAAIVKENTGRYAVEGATPSSMFVEVSASYNSSFVKVNGRYVHYQDYSDEQRSGLHLLVLHPSTGAVMARRFNPGHFKAGYMDIVQFLQRVQPGRIVVLCTQHEASFSLEPITRRYFATFAPHLAGIGRMSRYALVMRHGGAVFAEGYVFHKSMRLPQEPLLVTATVPIDPELGRPCMWTDRTRAQQRTDFCDKYEGFGGLCNCSDPDPLDRPFRPLLHNRTFHYPIAILGGDRASYLYRSLETLLPNRGLNKTRVTIFLQDYYEEVQELAALLDIRVVVKTTSSSAKGGKISMNMKNAIKTSFELFPDADKLIVLEDDLYVSPDFISYFAQTAPLLDEDVTLYCVSAWNDLSYRHSSADPALLYRTSYFPGLGWMMKKSILMDEMMPKWKPTWSTWDWDMWFRTEDVALYRECVVPDVSRTYHFAYLGGHVYSYLQYQYYSDKSLNTLPDVELHDVASMTYPNYRRSIYKLLPSLRVPPMKPFYRTCLELFPETPDPEERKRPYYLAFTMKHAYDRGGIHNIMSCLGLWDLDVRGDHRGMWRFFINGNPVIAMGMPFSEYGDGVMGAIGLTPVFDFKKYNIERKREPSLDGGNPKVHEFVSPDEEETEDSAAELDEFELNAYDETGASIPKLGE